ncbi:MAG TPA: hypothetical protein VFX44_04270 [Solirubrobacterales bacterium]|nr:hypothetical protein [Solirubrobacterales bacterium]
MKNSRVIVRPRKEGADLGLSGVVILGPGRSGTSAIARAFLAAGYFAGGEDEVLGAAAGNPLGHYEPLPVLRLNEELLAELGHSWWADRPDPEAQLRERERIQPRLEAVLRAMAESAAGSPLVVKEPRINSLLPLWGPVLDNVLHPVLALRDPVEIALSHNRRDGTTPAHALAAWEVQMATVLEWLDGRTVSVAPYAQLLERPQLASELVAAASAHLEPASAARIDPGAASAALDAGLRHEMAGAAAQAEYLTARQTELWDFLRSLPAGEVELSAPQELRSPSEAALIAVHKESEQIDFAATHGDVCRQLEEAGARLTELEQSRAQARNELERAEARHAAEVAEIANSVSWRITAPLRGVAKPRASDARG